MPDVNHHDIVLAEHAKQPPERTKESVLAFTLRVLGKLPRHERPGLVRSFAGAENTLPFHGVLVRVGRICYPDGDIYKIATDIPTTNAPVWHEDDHGKGELYFDVAPFLTSEPEPTGGGPSDSGGGGDRPKAGEYEDEFAELLNAVAKVITEVVELRRAVLDMGTRFDALRKEGIPLRLRL